MLIFFFSGGVMLVSYLSSMREFVVFHAHVANFLAFASQTHHRGGCVPVFSTTCSNLGATTTTSSTSTGGVQSRGSAGPRPHFGRIRLRNPPGPGGALLPLRLALLGATWRRRRQRCQRRRRRRAGSWTRALLRSCCGGGGRRTRTRGSKNIVGGGGD